MDADIYAEIDRLHEEAEELADRAKHVTDPTARLNLKTQAQAKVRQAARLRAQVEEV